MFLIISNYVVPTPQVDPHRAQHSKWVEQYIKSGDFIMAGPRRGKNGGVIVSRSMDKDRLMEILAEDSFVIENLVEMQIVDFDAPFTSAAFKQLQDM
ncbi:MAG: cyclohydrolase [Gammaproteobacteria bacterium]|nr:cyclohydrolase [Gammaproteobacteria bacterium]